MALGMATICAMAQKPLTPPRGGKAISDQLIGVFFEDLSYASDGGLNAQLVQNGSFEYTLAEKAGWGSGTAWRSVTAGHSTGRVGSKTEAPIHPNNPTYMTIYVERVGHFDDSKDGLSGVGLSNEGFDGMVIKAGQKYDFSVFVRNEDVADKDFAVSLIGYKMPEPGRRMPPQVLNLAQGRFKASGEGWKKYELTLTATLDCDNASLQLLAMTEGTVGVDMVSLLPEDTFKGHGLRRDLAEAVYALNPKFMRFPGGCVVHGGGNGFWNTYRWKESVGPKETRRQQPNPWGYHQSLELGYYEYFQFCEDMGAKPLPILPLGVSCQGAGGGWSLPNYAQMAVPMDEMDEWVEDALDLIEWANGDASTKWGAVRAAAGHPEPFHLELLGIGNEEYISPEFRERFKYIFDKVKEAHPEITIVGTAGVDSHPTNTRDYVNGWEFASEIGLPIMDEHYYEPRDYFLTSRQYDSYPRDRKTKVYLGEYASKGNTLIDALSEALYLCHVERNADVVVMTSYAPLFMNRLHSSWRPDLILFDNTQRVLTCNYYVQKMFGASSGSVYYGDCVKIEDADNLQEQSVVLNPEKRELYIKLCNAGEKSHKAQLDLRRFRGVKSAEKLTLKGRPDDANDFDSQEIVPVSEPISIAPKMTLELEPYSFSMITVKL